MSPADQDELASLEEDFKALRTEYEKYFAGVERIEPLKDRDRVKTTLRRLTTTRTPNTAMRYRLQTLQASMITYESYWNRITRQIEEGTYHRDLFRLAHKQQLAGEQAPAAKAPTPAETRPAAAAPGAATPTPVAAARPQAPTTAAPPTVYPEALRTLHTAFAKARAETGDPRPVSIDSLAATVKKQIAAIKERYKCERVEFSVAVKDGKAILKATPK